MPATSHILRMLRPTRPPLHLTLRVTGFPKTVGHRGAVLYKQTRCFSIRSPSSFSLLSSSPSTGASDRGRHARTCSWSPVTFFTARGTRLSLRFFFSPPAWISGSAPELRKLQLRDQDEAGS